MEKQPPDILEAQTDLPLLTRFNPDQPPHPEWIPFGSYLFALPLLEYTEAGDSCLLSVNLAWDKEAAAAGMDLATGVDILQGT